MERRTPVRLFSLTSMMTRKVEGDCSLIRLSREGGNPCWLCGTARFKRLSDDLKRKWGKPFYKAFPIFVWISSDNQRSSSFLPDMAEPPTNRNYSYESLWLLKHGSPVIRYSTHIEHLIAAPLQQERFVKQPGKTRRVVGNALEF